MNICIIPAKSTSTRIPGKNTREFCGRAAILYSLEAATESGLFDKIIVSTDDDKIGNIAAAHGGIYFKRAQDAMQEDSPMVDAILEVLAKETTDWDTVCMVYACAPFIQAATLKEAYSVHDFHGSAVTTAIYESQEHAEYSLLMREGKLTPRHPEHINANSQAFPATYQNAGQFFIANVTELQRSRTFAPANMTGVVVQNGIDIDTEADWVRAEAMFVLNNHPSLMKWCMANVPVIAECEAMGTSYGSIKINYKAGEVSTIDRSTVIRNKVRE